MSVASLKIDSNYTAGINRQKEQESADARARKMHPVLL